MSSRTIKKTTYIIGKLDDIKILTGSFYKTVNNIFLVCSGLGFMNENYTKNTLQQLNQFCLRTSSNMYICRGLYDDPTYFNSAYSMSNVNLVPDGEIIEIENVSILFMGGGVPLDRLIRIKGCNYFDLPEITNNTIARMKSEQVSVVISHSPPDLFNVPNLKCADYWYQQDSRLKDLEADFKASLTTLNLDSDTHIKNWYFYHTSEFKRVLSGTFYKAIRNNSIHNIILK